MIELLLPRPLRRFLRVGATRTESEEAEDENVQHNLSMHSRAVDELKSSVDRAKEVNQQMRATIRNVRHYLMNGGVIDN